MVALRSTNGAQYDVGQLEFDPIKIKAERLAFFEALLRDRVNQAARGVTCSIWHGSNLDAIASRYPGGVPRQSVRATYAIAARLAIT